jgi:hypothetical protein
MQNDKGHAMLIGECNCGQIAFEITGEHPDVYVCHCSICQCSTGSNGIAVLVIGNEDFSWTRGEHLVSTWKKPGHDWKKWFCRNCGSPLPGENDESRMFIPAGLLSGENIGLKVAHHIWVSSKAEWDVIGDSGKQHMEAYNPLN